MRVLMLIACLSFSTLARGAEKETSHVIEHPNKNEYSFGFPGSDKHKYGYELKESSKYFHHTTTEEDGVRLGCYGFILEGKKYSTQYVADVRGYRPVYTHDAITVYPKTGEERKASFVGDFNENEQRSQNIRYFFPDGCKGADTKISQPVIPAQPKVVVKPTDISPPPKTPKVIAPPPRTFQPPVTNKIENKEKIEKSQPKPKIQPRPVEPSPSQSIISQSKVRSNVCDAKSCCGDNKPKIVLPVPLKGKSGETCESFGKLSIPIEGLDLESLKLLVNGSDDF